HCAVASFSQLHLSGDPRAAHSCPTRRSSDLTAGGLLKISRAQYTSTGIAECNAHCHLVCTMLNTSKTVEHMIVGISDAEPWADRSEEHTSELQSREKLVCRLLLEKKKIGSSY